MFERLHALQAEKQALAKQAAGGEGKKEPASSPLPTGFQPHVRAVDFNFMQSPVNFHFFPRAFPPLLAPACRRMWAPGCHNCCEMGCIPASTLMLLMCICTILMDVTTLRGQAGRAMPH